MASLTDSGEIVLTNDDLIKNRLIAPLLKSRGMPLDGFVEPKMKPGYIYERRTDPETFKEVFSWKKVDA